jgi:hypothetical protein
MTDLPRASGAAVGGREAAVELLLERRRAEAEPRPRVGHCPGRKPPTRAVKRPARPYKKCHREKMYYGKC